MIRPDHTAWTPYCDARLRELWAEELSTRAIGDIMGRGKNSICARARRLDLEMRKQPVIAPRDWDIIIARRMEMDKGRQAAIDAIAKEAERDAARDAWRSGFHRRTT